MKKMGLELQVKIIQAYLGGISYRHIQDIFKVSRWNIQDALSKAGIRTNRIKSPPRLPGRACKYKKKVEFIPIDPDPGRDKMLTMAYNKDSFVPNPIYEDDLDYQERYDLADTESESEYLEIDISENDEVRYVKR